MADTRSGKYVGMTVNERLFESGQLETFDRAARSRNRQEMLVILESVEVDNAASTVDAILEYPEKYGY